LQVPLTVCWDNLNTYVSAVMRKFTGAHPDWLTVVQLPPYAPGLNPVEGVRAHMDNGRGNLAACKAGQLVVMWTGRYVSGI
jgi:transposase